MESSSTVISLDLVRELESQFSLDKGTALPLTFKTYSESLKYNCLLESALLERSKSD